MNSAQATIAPKHQAFLRAWLGTGSLNIFGLPFAGKDVQSAKLGQFFRARVVSGGQLLRDNPDLPERIKQKMDRGELIDIEDYVKYVVPVLKSAEYAGKPLVYSSVGRFDGEQESVIEASEIGGHPQRAVIFLDVSMKVAEEHRQEASGKGDRGLRADDSPEVIPRRFREYRLKTGPVIDWYRQERLLVTIDGSGTPEEVFDRILEGLLDFANSVQTQAVP